MPLIFEGNPGQVAWFKDPAVSGVLQPLTAVSPELGFDQQRSIFTRIMLAQQTNVQFQHMLGADIYVYVFGDRIGQLTIHGMSFARTCDESAQQHGAELVHTWYQDNKASARRSAVQVVIGRKTVLNGFVVGLTTSFQDPVSWITEFALSLMVVPTLNIANRG